MIIFKKENMGADKPVSVVILPPVRFIGGPTSKLITGIIKGSWDLERSLYVINMVGIPVEESLAYIVMKTINVVIHMVCDGEAS